MHIKPTKNIHKNENNEFDETTDMRLVIYFKTTNVQCRTQNTFTYKHAANNRMQASKYCVDRITKQVIFWILYCVLLFRDDWWFSCDHTNGLLFWLLSMFSLLFVVDMLHKILSCNQRILKSQFQVFCLCLNRWFCFHMIFSFVLQSNLIVKRFIEYFINYPASKWCEYFFQTSNGKKTLHLYASQLKILRCFDKIVFAVLFNEKQKYFSHSRCSMLNGNAYLNSLFMCLCAHNLNKDKLNKTAGVQWKKMRCVWVMKMKRMWFIASNDSLNALKHNIVTTKNDRLHGRISQP